MNNLRVAEDGVYAPVGSLAWTVTREAANGKRTSRFADPASLTLRTLVLPAPVAARAKLVCGWYANRTTVVRPPLCHPSAVQSAGSGRGVLAVTTISVFGGIGSEELCRELEEDVQAPVRITATPARIKRQDGRANFIPRICP